MNNIGNVGVLEITHAASKKIWKLRDPLTIPSSVARVWFNAQLVEDVAFSRAFDQVT